MVFLHPLVTAERKDALGDMNKAGVKPYSRTRDRFCSDCQFLVGPQGPRMFLQS